MNIKILGTGSKGNCYILTSKNKSQIILECGIKISEIMKNINYELVNFCLYSHNHKDHSLSLKTLEKWCIEIYGIKNLKDGELFSKYEWKILPLYCQHNVPCYGYWIKNINENLLFFTDTNTPPRIKKGKHFNIVMAECNYDENLIKKLPKEELIDKGHLNHCSLQSLISWLEKKELKIDNLMLIHKSERNRINEKTCIESLKKYSKNVFFAKNNMEVKN